MSEPTPFSYPKLHCGQVVQVSFDKSFSKPMMGLVNLPKANSAVLIIWDLNGRAKIYPDCRHRDDPYLAEHPAFIGAPGHAIFALTEEAQERAVIKTTVDTLVKIVEQQAKEIVELKAAVAAIPFSDGDGQVRRGPGRPKRLEPVEVA